MRPCVKYGMGFCPVVWQGIVGPVVVYPWCGALWYSVNAATANWWGATLGENFGEKILKMCCFNAIQPPSISIRCNEGLFTRDALLYKPIKNGFGLRDEWLGILALQFFLGGCFCDQDKCLISKNTPIS